jgi:multicomponent Na+:H+ antiporter subunit D
MTAHLPILPLVTTLVGALLIPIVAPWSRRAPRAIALAAVFAAAALALGGLADVAGAGARRYPVGGWPPPWGIELVLDPLSAFMAAAVASVAALGLLAAGPSARAQYGDGAPAYHALALVALTGYLGIIASGDLFNVFVFLEIAAIASYALVASGGGSALLAAFRYLVLGTVGASFYLVGVGQLYALTGSLNMADLAARLPALVDSPLLAGGAAFLVTGLAVKMALFPLHGWLPDAYATAPAPVTAFLPAVGTKAAAYALARIAGFVLPSGDLPLGAALAWAGAVAIVAGGAAALRQSEPRRLLAWSSVSQMGYIALGLGLANPAALAGAYLHVLNHAMMKAALFVAVGAGLAGRGAAALPAACVVVAALSMVGVPPAGGFFSKWYLLQGAVADGQPLLVAAIVAGSLLALGYMYRLTGALWFPPAATPDAPGPEVAAPRPVLAALVLLAAGILVVGLGSGALVERGLVPSVGGVTGAR